MLHQETLDRLWNFEDPGLSEQRFRDALADPTYNTDEKAELATQLGRAIGLQGRYEEADALLDTIDGEDEPTVGIRVLLERGRVLNSSGHAAMAVPLFEQTAELGDHLGDEFLAVDALHMLAAADSAHAESWTRSALEYASTAHDPHTRRWMAGCTTTWACCCTEPAGSPRPWWNFSLPSSGPSRPAPRRRGSAPGRPFWPVS